MKKEINQNQKKRIDKIYLKQIQKEIDDLEKQLFSYDDTINIHKQDKLIFNKKLDIPYNVNYNEKKNLEEENIEITHSDTEAEKDELYNIILRERKEYNELDKVRKAQNEKYKQSENKCKLLEKHNYNLQNNMEILQKEKIEQEKKIIELQKEIDKLRKEKSREIQYKNEKLTETFNQNYNNMNYI